MDRKTGFDGMKLRCELEEWTSHVRSWKQEVTGWKQEVTGWKQEVTGWRHRRLQTKEPKLQGEFFKTIYSQGPPLNI